MISSTWHICLSTFIVNRVDITLPVLDALAMYLWNHYFDLARAIPAPIIAPMAMAAPPPTIAIPNNPSANNNNIINIKTTMGTANLLQSYLLPSHVNYDYLHQSTGYDCPKSYCLHSVRKRLISCEISV